MQIYAIIKDFQMRKRIRDYFSGQTASYTIALCAAVALFMALSNLNIVINVCRSIFSVMSPFVYAFAVVVANIYKLLHYIFCNRFYYHGDGMEKNLLSGT